MESFPRTATVLQRRSPFVHAATLAVVVAVTGLWLGWFFAASLSVRVSAASARVVSNRAPVAVHLPVSGTLASLRVGLGDHVQAGEVIAEVETEALRLELAEAQARLRKVRAQMESVERRIDAEARAQEVAVRGKSAGQRGARAAHASARIAAARSAERVQTIRRLADDHVAPDAEVRDAVAEAERERLAAQVHKQDVDRAGWERQALEHQGSVKHEELRERLVEFDGMAAELEASMERIEFAILRRQLRSPTAGAIGEVGELAVGVFGEVGEHVFTVVPDAQLKVVAQLPPSAVGRVHGEEAGTLWLDGYPWAQFGTLRVRVLRVATEVRDGTVRAELALSPDYDGPIPLQHGMVGDLEIELERATPARLVLRSIGAQLGGRAR